MKRWLIVAALGMSSGMVLGQNHVLPGCEKGTETQSELHRCASEDAKRADAELEGAYRQLFAAMANDKVATGKAKAEQAAWKKYQDAFLQAMYPAEDKQSYGTIFPMEFDMMAADMARGHIPKVKEILRSYQEDHPDN